MKDDLRAVREEYADPRRTEIAFDPADISMEDLIADEDCVVTVTHGGYLKRTLTSVYREQKRGGKGLNGMDTKEEDWVEHVFNCSAHDWMLFFTEQGRMYFRKAYDIPDSGRTSRGKAIVNFLQMGEGEKIAAILPVRGFTGERNLFFATERGIVKKTPLAAYKNVRAAGLIAIRVEEGDRVVGVELTGGEDEIMLVTRQGQGIRFKETDVRTMGRPAAGVIGIRLAEGDAVEGLECVRGTARLLTITEKGYGKRTDFGEYRLQHRGGSGLIANELTGKTGPLVTALTVEDDACIMLVTKSGIMIRIPVDGIRVTGRNAQGVKLIDLEDGDTVMSATPVDPEEQKSEGTPDPEGDGAEAAPEAVAETTDEAAPAGPEDAG